MHRYLLAAKKLPVDRPPVWLMRQAGRYLPEYRATKEKAGTFLNLCKTPELAMEVTLQPLRRFELDAAIIFSDILTIPDAMGLGLDFVGGCGPQFEKPLYDLRNFSLVETFDVTDRLSYVAEAIKMTKREMKVPLLGFSGAPITLALYMIEGQGGGFKRAIDFRYEEPEKFATIIETLTTLVADYLLMQAKAGADALMLFDTWATLLSAQDIQTFGIEPAKEIVAKVHAAFPDIPITVYEKGVAPELVATTGANVVGIDHHQSLSAAARIQPALQGNLHPAVMRHPDTVEASVKALFEAFPAQTGHIFNLGHGVTPDVPVASVNNLIEAVKAYGTIKESTQCA